jgi:hypothetical protein
MPGPQLDSPPPLPDGVKASMSGGGPFAGVGEMLAGKKPPTAGGGGGPQGALKAQGDAVMKVLEQMVGSSQAGKTFFSRAMKMVEQGIAAEAQGGPGAPANPDRGGGEGPASAGEGSMKPPPAFPG